MPRARTIHNIGRYRISNRIEERRDLAERYNARRVFVLRGDLLPSGTIKDLRNAALLKKFSDRNPLVIPQITSGNSGRSFKLLAKELDPNGERIKLVNISAEEIDEKVKNGQGDKDTYLVNLGNGRIYMQFMRELARQHLNTPKLPARNIIGVEHLFLREGYSSIVDDIAAELGRNGIVPTHISCPLGAGELLAEIGWRAMEVYGDSCPTIIGNTISRNPFAGQRSSSEDAIFACKLADKLETDVSNYLVSLERLISENILRVKTLLSGKELKEEYESINSLGISAEPSAVTAFCGIKNFGLGKNSIIVIINSGRGNFNPDIVESIGQENKLGVGTSTLLEYSALVERDPEKAKRIRGRKLLEAVKNNDNKTFTFFMAENKSNPDNVSLEERDDKGNTPLCLAAAKGFANFTERLLRQGADNTVINNEGKTPLMLACMQKDIKELERRKEISTVGDLAVAYLRQDLEGITEELIDEKYWTDRYYVKVVCNLLENGADIFQRDYEGRGMLLAAIEGENRQIISEILKKAREIYEKEVKEIEEEFDGIEKEDEEPETFDKLMGLVCNDIFRAGMPSKKELLNKIKNKHLKLFENQAGTSPLICAIDKEDEELAEILIEHTVSLGGKPF